MGAYLSDLQYIAEDSIWCPIPIRRLSAQAAAQDWIIGDPHGRNDLIADFLKQAESLRPPGKTLTRVFSVGDNIDRGYDGLEILRRTNRPHFYSVRGNHEQILLDLHYRRMVVQKQPADPDVLKVGAHLYHQRWFLELTQAEQVEALNLAYRLPLIIEVETSEGLDAIVHAEIPRGRIWNQITAAVLSRDINVWNQILWGRERIGCLRAFQEDSTDQQVPGIRRIWHGHNPIPVAQTMGNLWFIDTSAHKAPTVGQEKKDRPANGLTVIHIGCRNDVLTQGETPRGAVRIIG